MIDLAATVGPPALTAVARVALLAAAIFAALRWRSLPTACAVAASLVFARGILFLMSDWLHLLARYGDWSAVRVLTCSNLAPVGLIVWLLWSNNRAAAWALAFFEIGVLVIGGALLVSAVSNDARVGIPLFEMAAAAIPVRLAIIAAVVAVATRQAIPWSASRAR